MYTQKSTYNYKTIVNIHDNIQLQNYKKYYK